MERKKPSRPEQYRVIISSETDARKEPAAFNIKHRTAVIAAAGVLLVVVISAGLTVMSIFQASYYSQRIEMLKTQVDVQSSILDMYSNEIESMQTGLNDCQAEVSLTE
jgi:uncharacterized protein HemX